MRRKKASQTFESDLVVQDILDAFDHPAWVCDQWSKCILSNDLAKDMDVAFIGSLAPGLVTVCSKKYSLAKRPLRGQGDIVLCELNPVDEAAQRIRQCSVMLDAALSRYS